MPMGSDQHVSKGARLDAAGFESTHWSVVLQAAQQDSPAGQRALALLYRTYWKPIFAFIRRHGRSLEQAEDLTQDFFTELIEKNWLAAVSQEGGKFRAVLLTALRHFLSHARDHDRAQKRGSGRPLLPLDRKALEELPGPADLNTPEREFDRRWALGLLEATMNQLREEYTRSQKVDLFEELKGFLSSRPLSYAEIAARHEISINAVTVAVHRLRKRYGELLRSQVARTVGRPSEVDDEMRHLLSILSS